MISYFCNGYIPIETEAAQASSSMETHHIIYNRYNIIKYKGDNDNEDE